MAELLKDVPLVLADGSKVKGDEHLQGKVVALYFSAGWCPPCRAFTPHLKKFYKTVKEETGKNFEVVFVSRDRAEEDLVEYFKDHHGPWTYIPYGDEHIQEFLQKFEVKTIPTLRVIKPDGTVVIHDARTEVQDNKEDPLKLFEEWSAKYNA